MAIHLTPTELGREAGMHRRDVIAKCMELGVPIFQGRIDKTLFMSTLKHDGSEQGTRAEPERTRANPLRIGSTRGLAPRPIVRGTLGGRAYRWKQ